MVLIQRANKQLQIPEDWIEQYESAGYKRIDNPAPKSSNIVVNKEPKRRSIITTDNAKNTEE